jgi:exosortase D (VPLPA-CTERM-specific)
MTAERIFIDRLSSSMRTPTLGGGLLLTIATIGIVCFFWTGLTSLFSAWSRPEYSHGYLIIPIALYLFLLTLDREGSAPDERALRRGPGVLTVLIGLALGLVGNLVKIPDLVTYGLIVCVAGLVLTVLGSARGLRFWAPVAYLVFMLPLPMFLYLPLSIKLQTVSSQLGVGLLSLLGVPVFLDGNIIDLGIYKLQVAEACSGLRYLFPLMSFGFLFAVLYKGPIWQKIVLFISTIPITVLMNSLRIAIVGFLVNRYGIEHAEGFLHFFEGWVIFILCLAILYLEAAVLQRFARDPQPVYAIVDVGSPSLFKQFTRLRSVPMSRALGFASLAILFAGIAWQVAPARDFTTPDRDSLALFPLKLENWRGERKRLDANVERVLAADDYLVADYTNAQTRVNLLIAYYKSQTEAGAIHSPEVCLPSGGWEISHWDAVDTGLRTKSGTPLFVNRAIIQKGFNRALVYYWFEGRGRSLTNDYVAKAYLALDGLTQGRTDGALVRIVTPIKPTEADDVADSRLRDFLALLLPTLPRYVAS